jgi:LemA protein
MRGDAAMEYAIIGIAIVAIILIAIIWFITKYNGFIKLSTRLDNAFSQIDVYLKKRFDLIPNLVSTVKGYAKHESETLEKIIAARSAAYKGGVTGDIVKAEGELSSALSRLLAVSEQYPDLKANANFIDLQHQLKDIESQLAFSRQFYNDAAMKFNQAIQLFPANIVASMFNFTSREYFKIDEGEKSTPKVEF